jgi:hypothetical protein
MTIETWGEMPESQISDKTIAEKIAEMISDHEADPTSHMGIGESIDEHRKNTVIDHPAQSVLADKPAPFLSGALLFQEDGRGSGGWIIAKTGADNEVNPGMLSINIHGENATGTRADVAIPLGGYNITFATEHAWLEFSAMFSGSESIDSWVSICYGLIYTYQNGFGFRYKASNQHLYAFHKIGTTYYDTDLGTVPADEFHKYKVELVDNTFNFYVDGSFVCLQNSNMPTGWNASLITFGVVPKTGSSGSLYLRFLQYYQSSAMTMDP